MKGVLREGWTTIKLQNLVTFRKGKKPLTLQTELSENFVPYLDIQAIEKKEVIRYADKDSSRLCSEKDLLVVWDGARSGWVGLGREGAVGSTIMALEPRIEERKFLYYWLQTKFNLINGNTRGTGIPHVDPDVFWNLETPFAPLNEQRRIVAKLEKLLEKVESGRTRLEKIPALFKRFRQSVLAAACSGHLTEEWRNKWRESRQDWASVGFFDFCILQRGYDLPLSQAIEGPYPIVTSAGVVAYHNKFKAQRPGVVTGRSGSIGRVFFIEEDYWPHNTALYVRDFRGNDPKFVYFFLLGFDTSQYSASTAVPTLNRNNLREIFIEVPPLPEQHEIVRRVEELFALADRIEARYQKAKAQVDKLTQSILSKAFRGELVPQDPTDEPASELLKRIQTQKIEKKHRRVPNNRKKGMALKDCTKNVPKDLYPAKDFI